MAKKKDQARELRIAAIDNQIIGINVMAEIMRANAGDEFDRAYLNRSLLEANKRIEGLQKERGAPAPEVWKPKPPQPCPMKQQPAACYRRDGEAASVDAGLLGMICKGCEWKISTLEGKTP